MPTMPTDVTFGKVVGLFLIAAPDSIDGGRLPDAAVPTGLVIKLTPGTPNITTTTPSAIVARQTYTCQIDADGNLIDSQNAIGIWVPTGIYTASYTADTITIPSHQIEVLSSHNDASPLNLVTAIDPGTPLVPTQYTELNNRVTALESAESSDPWTYAVATTDTGNDTVTPAAVTGLSITGLAAGLYELRGLVIAQAAVAGTGVRMGMEWSGMSAYTHSRVLSASSDLIVGHASGVVAATTNAPFSVSSVQLATQFYGILRVTGSSDSINAVIASEVAGSMVTAKADSFLAHRRIAD